MQIVLNILYIVILLLALLYLVWLMLSKKQDRQQIKIRDAFLTSDELQNHAKEIAIEHAVSKNVGDFVWPVPRMNDNYRYIMSVYKELNEDVMNGIDTTPAAEWLLDNFYIIEEQVKSIRRDLTKKYYSKLPMLSSGHLKGYARIYSIALELVSHTDGRIDEKMLIDYINAYQSNNVLTTRELWALPIMIKLALVENMRYICERITQTQRQRRKVEEILDDFDENNENIYKLINAIDNELKGKYQVSPAFIEHLAYRFRKMGKAYSHVLGYIDERLGETGTTVDLITHKEHNEQTVRKASIGNCIMSLKFISITNWVDIFERLNSVEKILREDPEGSYPLLDLPTRDYYRKRVEELAMKFSVSETHVAKKALELAQNALERQEEYDARFGHVGYYLVGKGIKDLEKEIGYEKKFIERISEKILARPGILYMGSIGFIMLLLTAGAVYYSVNNSSEYQWVLTVIAGLAVIIPVMDIAVNAVNWIISRGLKPSFLPKIEIKGDIPEEHAAMVVIPALLPDEKRVLELIDNLEVYYLANKEKNLYFSLAGDYKDAPKKETPQDKKIIETALNRISELNKKYSSGDRNIFYFFHRHRQFSDRQNKWMGWERKRGALLEFNEVLLGSKSTSYSIMSEELAKLPKVKYVITIDADTILPLGAAKRLIGTMAHPLNRPVIDKTRGVVVEGYGLLQPRIGFDIESTNKSLFSRIFAGEEGIDPYASAISDVYQDLFGEGIFTGKGIYDLEVFQELLKNAIPDNTVLSHDLLEGSYVRTGLVTDVQLVDGYPSKVNSHAMRHHRWVRGDWQLLPWLKGHIKDKAGNVIKNPLSSLTKWKIIDNLRRSMVAPSLMLLLFLGFSVLPKSPVFWLLTVLLCMYFPLITGSIDHIISKRFGTITLRKYAPVISGLKASFLQMTLQFILLPYNAYLMVNAIVVTLFRVLITKKNMLEWVTALDTEKSLKNSLKGYVIKMKTAAFQSIIIVGLAAWLRPDYLVLAVSLFVVWTLSPFIAYWVSKETVYKKVTLSEKEELELRKIARKTWRYFEEFMNKRNNYLAPDNFQEDPPNGIAYRTSPTNIGLGMLAALTARDMGYIGTLELCDIVSRTMDTIDKMEKWNGHLYNWYTTNTLETLRPRYISTVDSGNFVCYLITLKEGLLEYLKRPLIDRAFVKGIEDTVSFINREKGSSYSDIACLDGCFTDNGGRIHGDAVLWAKALSELDESDKNPDSGKDVWKLKVDNMIDMLRMEIYTYMPWASIFNDLPKEFKNLNGQSETKKLLEDIQEELNADIALIEMPEVYRNVVKKIDKLKKTAKGGRNGDLLLNWFDELKKNLETAAENTQRLIERFNHLIERITKLSDETEFIHLYDRKRQLFSIGYNIEENSLTNSYYDLLASEARQTSYIAIARGEVEPEHWFKLGRTLTQLDRYKGMVSWSGTMFEYLMPLLIMKSNRNTLLDETYSFVVRGQKKYGRQRNVPWGTSESGFYAFDINLDYQYKAFGVPWLGLKRGLIEDMVVAPYATFLALPIDPEGTMENIKRLVNEGGGGRYGMYEAIDYTPERIPIGEKKGIVKSYMAHHQGMSILALNNYLNDNIMQERFHADPVVEAARLLLAEKVPSNIVFTKENKEKILPFKDVVYEEVDFSREFNAPDPVLPKAHILSNGSYSVMVTDKGTGYSRNKHLDVTRWREDISQDNYGKFFYIRDVKSNEAWSAAYAPFGRKPDEYKITFTSGKARFLRRDGNISTQTEMVVCAGDNAEIRRITLTNNGTEECVLEVTSYFELVLAPHGADVAHPAFSNLFIRTEFVPEHNCIIASRRPRTENDKTLWMVSRMLVEGEAVGGLQYETDRMQFIGRGRDVSNPVALEPARPLSNTCGAVLDPIVSFRQMVRIEPGKPVKVSFVTAIAETREDAIEIAAKYSSAHVIKDEISMAITRSRVEARYLSLVTEEIELFQNLISHILFIDPHHRKKQDCIKNNKKGQSALWSYGISGDIPIVLVMLDKTEDIDIVQEILKAHEYWKIKNIKVDLVILNEEENSYTNPLNSLLYDVLAGSHAHDLINKPGGVFVLKGSNMPPEDIDLICAVSRIVLKGDAGDLREQMRYIKIPSLPEFKSFKEEPVHYEQKLNKDTDLAFYNGLGGFKQDGREYVIYLENGHNTPLPWINVISNRKFGFIVTESGAGYTWYENSRENKLTPWSNDPVSDTPGEILYILDDHTGETWSVTPLPIREEGSYKIRHGFGYTIFEHVSHGIGQEMTQFVPVEDSVKISILKLVNKTDKPRNLSVTYYIRPVLGVSDQFTATQINTEINSQGVVSIRNNYNDEFPGRVAFVDSSIKDRTITCDRKEFFGMGSIKAPEAIKRVSLSGTVGAGFDPCAAMNVNVSLEPGEEKELIFLLGAGENAEETEYLSKKYRKLEEVKKALEEVKKFWEEKLGAVQFYTQNSAMDILLNGWLMYQVISSRLWTRSAFYQSGGAYGFRDQLQDSMAVTHVWPEVTRAQILLHSKHQFIEGDVQHWWHEEKYKGTRTRFSDDLLWMPYVTEEYIKVTGDYEILKEETPFLEDEPLKDFEDEAYRIPRVSETVSTLYDHCIRAINRSLRFGERGLPLIGSGDWNDGMNTVGNKGKGESVWLGWFLYSILKGFAPLCERMGDTELAKSYLETADKIVLAIEENAWDGSWYRRAYFDNGVPLGSIQNSECKIDSLAQTWAVISEGGNKDRIIEAMNALENYLVKRDEGLIQLLTPPFDQSDLEPGYIKSYVPGVRENGGQYTHAAAWVVMAFAKMGDGDKALELFDLLNPINHSRTAIEYSRYKVEPYVMAADVYSVPPHTGRGGWTWYTGSAGWIYRVGFEYILGFKKQGEFLVIDPCIPKTWSGFDIKYRYKDIVYLIEVKNPDGVNRGVKKVMVDGAECRDKRIPLISDGKEHKVEVYLG
ncbi:MAG: glycosyl transferase [Clostridium sp.]|nr:glycosyl transferase [Clostridium sp.]